MHHYLFPLILSLCPSSFAPFVLKGAGREKSILCMTQPQLPKNPEQMWTSPPLILIKAPNIKPRTTNITKDAKLGSRLITLENTEHIKKGDWVKLSLLSRDTELMKHELGAHYDEVMKSNWNIAKEGIRIESIYQVKRVTGKRVELHTPLLVGFHGKNIAFTTSELVAEISPNKPVKPESLYEAQLHKRLGKIPSWLQELKKSQQ